MSVSLDHELMVLHLIHWLDDIEAPFRPRALLTECSLYPKVRNIPPAIQGHRPDLFAVSKVNFDQCLIGEVKTTDDLEKYRTESQLRSFVRYLMDVDCGYIVLGVTWSNVPCAKSILRKILEDEGAKKINALVVNCSNGLLQRDLW